MDVPALANEPEMDPSLVWAWRAYWALSGSRDAGMGVGAIPFEALDRYAARYGYRGEQFEHLADLIREMDAEFLKYQSERNGRANP